MVVQRRNLSKTYYQAAPSLKEKAADVYEQVIFYLPYSPAMSLAKVLSEVRKLFVSDVHVLEAKL